MHRTTLFLLAGFTTLALGACTASTDPTPPSTLPTTVEATTSTAATS